MIGECTGKVRSTPTPKLTLRTLKVSATRTPGVGSPRPGTPGSAPGCPRRPGRAPSRCRRGGTRARRRARWRGRRGRSGSWQLTLLARSRPPRGGARRRRLGGRKTIAVLREEAHLVLAEAAARLDEVGTALEGARQGHGAPPGRDPAVVAAAQHLGNLEASEARRPRVLGVLEQAGGEALLARRRLVAEHPGNEPGHRLEDDEGRELATGEHVVTDGELAVHERVGDALVDPLVAAAQQGERPELGEAGAAALVESLAARREQVERTGRSGRLHGREDRAGGEHHAGAAAEGCVVDGSPGVGGPRPQVVHGELEQPRAPGPAEDAGVRVRLDDVGEDREDRDDERRAHSKSPSGASTTTRPPVRATTKRSGTR